MPPNDNLPENNPVGDYNLAPVLPPEPSEVLSAEPPIVTSSPPTPLPTPSSSPAPAVEQTSSPAALEATVFGAAQAQPLPDITVVQTASVAAAPSPVSASHSATLDPHPAASNIFTEICTNIIREQERIIGVIALEQATHVTGLKVDPLTYRCEIIGDGSQVIDSLIEQYRDFFGHAAVEVCKEAASKFLSRIPEGMVPSSLR